MPDHPDAVPSLPPVAPSTTDNPLDRSSQQAAHEAVMREVAETISDLEQTIRRADRARRAVARDAEPNVTVALDRTIADLERVRQELFQTAYFGGAQQRLA